MAHPAILGGRYVRRRLAYRKRTVMARDTIIRDAIVIKDRRKKRRR